jgi:hypothetical protein
MRRARPILGFLCRFVVVFGLLVAPWPVWPEIYAQCLAKSATFVYGSFGSKGIVLFASNPPDNKQFDTIIYLGNRETLGADRSGPTATYSFNGRLLAYFPTALIIGLILAMDFGWRRRLGALLWGLVSIHVFIAFLLGLVLCWMCCARPELGLFDVSPFWNSVVSFLFGFFVAHINTRFSAVVLIWILIAFRRDDWFKIPGREGNRAGRSEKPTAETRTPSTENA